MSLHVIFIDNQGTQLSDVTSNFTSVTIPQNAFIMRIADDTKSYSNSMLTKLFEIDNTFYSKVLEYTTKGDYPFIDVSVQDFSGFTAIFNQLSAQFVGNNPPQDIYDFSGYGGSGSGGSIDFSTIVTALNGITTALSSLTNLSNLSNLADLANIITAINNKDNQSDLVSKLDNIFFYTANSKKRNIISGQQATHNYSSDWDTQYYSYFGLLHKLITVFSTLNASMYSSPAVYSNNNKYLGIISSLLSSGGNPNSQNSYSKIQDLSLLKELSQNLQNIESKLEQNLPFTTLAQVDVVTDYTQVVKGVGKNE